jgi:hypothetical protein
MMNMLKLPGLGTMHASAVEVYANHAYDLLADRKPLQVGNNDIAAAPKVGEEVSVANNSGSKGYPGMDKYKADQQKKIDFKAKLEARQREQAEAKNKGGEKGASKGTGKSKGDKNDEFNTVGETLLRISSPEDIARLARQVEASRVAHGHALNARSSRSHCLIYVHLMTTDAVTGLLHKKKIVFVDLAGSERIAKSKVEGKRAGEAVGIIKA